MDQPQSLDKLDAAAGAQSVESPVLGNGDAESVEEEQSSLEWVPFSKRKEWTDLIPISQNDGNVPVVAIDYSERFRETMDYFRAIVRASEKSERALEICAEAIALNSANYVAWWYWREVVHALKKDIRAELRWMKPQVLDCPKNYQVWFTRRELLESIGNGVSSVDVLEEKALIAEVLAEDAKNYHAWSHRRWFVQRFQCWSGEEAYTRSLIALDVRNNSAWSFRFFVFHANILVDVMEDERADILLCEMNYVFEQLKLAPNNESPYSYAFGLVRDSPALLEKAIESLQIICKENPLCIHARSTLQMCHEQQANFGGTSTEEAVSRYTKCAALCDELMNLDKIREKYWYYQKQRLESQKQIAASRLVQ